MRTAAQHGAEKRPLTEPLSLTEPFTATFDFEDGVPFDVVLEVAATWNLTYKQMQPGPNDACIAQLRFDGFELAYERYAQEVLVQGTRPDDAMAFGITESPAESCTHHCRALPPNALFWAPPPAEIDTRFRSCVSFVLMPADLQARLAPADFEALMTGTPHMLLRQTAAARLRALGHDALLAFKREPQLVKARTACMALRDRAIDEIASVFARSSGEKKPLPPLAARTRAARRCETYMRERLEQPITMRDLVEIAGVSERSLRAGFLDRFGHSPKAHLTTLRLNAARMSLRHPEDDTSVGDTAMRHGFWHLGRFSHAYHDHFGELPSETLRDARAALG